MHLTRYLLLRTADAQSDAEAGPDTAQRQAWAGYCDELRAAGVLREAVELQPSGVQVRFTGYEPQVEPGPIDGTQTLASFCAIETASRPEALEWAKRWPASNTDEARIEVRESGCPGGLGVQAPTPVEAGNTRYAVLLKSNAELDADIPPPSARLEAMSRRNEDGARAGVLLAGEGLKGSAKGTRLRIAGQRAAALRAAHVIDGPFAEIKEMVAGYWIIQSANLDGAIEWVRTYPYPFADAVVEIRPVR